jgi:hypothetical protein
MNLSKPGAATALVGCVTALAGFLPMMATALTAQQASKRENSVHSERESNGTGLECEDHPQGSPYIPVDSWVYPALLRLYSLGYIDTIHLNMRPLTRASMSNILDETSGRLNDTDASPVTDEAKGLYDALRRELRYDVERSCQAKEGSIRVESVYSVMRGISGTPLRDSYHLGSSIVNDYGRPFAHGFNNYSGASGYASAGRFLLYLRGEFQGASSASGYSPVLAEQLASIDGTAYFFAPTCWMNGISCVPLPYNQQATISAGPIAAVTNGRVVEAYVSAQYLNHVVSFGKQDDWLGPGLGGGMAYSNNAENIYSFRINRIEPLRVPLLSQLTGPFRYDFLVGPLKGHSYPIGSWVHVEKVGFRPTTNIELGFERTVIFGGKNHEPVNFRSFLRSFVSLTAPQPAVKNSPQDPGARFGAFDFSYRLPYIRNWLTLYADSEVHDDVSPIDAPRRASWRPGLYLSHVPGIPKLDLRAEAVSTDPPILNSNGGGFMYYEGIQRQGYTNGGQLFGDWIGREDKGGQAWITYHISGNEWIQLGMRNQKAAKDFITGGTTLNDISFRVVKRIGKDLEINGNFTFERWTAPIYLPGRQTVTTTTIQLTWFPNRMVNF